MGLLRDVPVERQFVLADGRKIANLKQFSQILSTMSPDLFRKHVTTDRNDFFSWVFEVVRDDKLAFLIKDIRNLEEMSNKVEARVLWLEEDTLKQLEHRIEKEQERLESEEEKLEQEEEHIEEEQRKIEEEEKLIEQEQATIEGEQKVLEEERDQIRQDTKELHLAEKRLGELQKRFEIILTDDLKEEIEPTIKERIRFALKRT